MQNKTSFYFPSSTLFVLFGFFAFNAFKYFWRENSNYFSTFFVVKIHVLFHFFCSHCSRIFPGLFGFFKALSILELLLHWKVWKKRLKPSNFKRWWTLGSELFYIYNVPDSRITRLFSFIKLLLVPFWCGAFSKVSNVSIVHSVHLWDHENVKKTSLFRNFFFRS